MTIIKTLATSLAVLSAFTFSNSAVADYETFTSKIDQIYVLDNGTDQWGIRIKLVEPGDLCTEWYVKSAAPLKNEMYTLALTAKVQDLPVSIMRRNDSENIANTNGIGNICSVHRIYLK